MPVNYAAFGIGFWHPFGPHGGETTAQILQRKVKEIAENGWTLWSFQHRTMLDAWQGHLISAAPEEVLVFCSAGGGNDPLNRGGTVRVADCRSYRFVGETEWRSTPERVRVPHTFRFGRGHASAFVIQRIIHPVEPFDLPAVEWLSEDGQWRKAFQSGQGRGIPSRGEYLIRPGGTCRMRKVGAVLELRPPYLAVVSTLLEPDNPSAQPTRPTS
jgi:hypothetical protein